MPQARSSIVVSVDKATALKACAHASRIIFNANLLRTKVKDSYYFVDEDFSAGGIFVQIDLASVANGTRVEIRFTASIWIVQLLWFLPLTMRKFKNAIVQRARDLSEKLPDAKKKLPDAKKNVASLRPGSVRVFISYRRDDSRDVCGRINDRLVDALGADWVFHDVDAIELGVDFREKSLEAVRQCDIFVAVIGPEWHGVVGESSTSRLYDEGDLLRLEIEEALQHKIPIVPVLVRGACMPSAKDLPDSIGALTTRNALELRSDNFRNDMDRLMRALASIGGRSGSRIKPGGKRTSNKGR